MPFNSPERTVMNVSTARTNPKKRFLRIGRGVNQGSTIAAAGSVTKKRKSAEDSHERRQIGDGIMPGDGFRARFKLAGTNEQMECAPAEQTKRKRERGRDAKEDRRSADASFRSSRMLKNGRAGLVR